MGEKGNWHMASNYRYVSDKDEKLKRRRKELGSILDLVRVSLKEKLYIEPSFRVGSGGRNMVTELVGGNEGFDLDCNLKVRCIDREYSATEIRGMIMKAFNLYAPRFSYSPAEDSTRVFKFKIKDTKEKKIIFSCDFAILREIKVNGKGEIQIIHFDKKSTGKNPYCWDTQTQPYRLLEKEEKFCKDKGYWSQVRNKYLELKCKYEPSKPSIDIYVETLDAISSQHKFKPNYINSTYHVVGDFLISELLLRLIICIFM